MTPVDWPWPLVALLLVLPCVATLGLLVAWNRVQRVLEGAVWDWVHRAFLVLMAAPLAVCLFQHDAWASWVPLVCTGLAAGLLGSAVRAAGVGSLAAGHARRGGRPASVLLYRRQHYPVYVRHPMAVYETSPGEYSVMGNGSAWGKAFHTTDADLAMVVCDRWADEFAKTVPWN